MSYLFGFPTPVVEVLLVMLCIILSSAIYFGLQFEPVETIEEETITAGTEASE